MKLTTRAKPRDSLAHNHYEGKIDGVLAKAACRLIGRWRSGKQFAGALT